MWQLNHLDQLSSIIGPICHVRQMDKWDVSLTGSDHISKGSGFQWTPWKNTIHFICCISLRLEFTSSFKYLPRRIISYLPQTWSDAIVICSYKTLQISLTVIREGDYFCTYTLWIIWIIYAFFIGRNTPWGEAFCLFHFSLCSRGLAQCSAPPRCSMHLDWITQDLLV